MTRRSSLRGIINPKATIAQQVTVTDKSGNVVAFAGAVQPAAPNSVIFNLPQTMTDCGKTYFITPTNGDATATGLVLATKDFEQPCIGTIPGTCDPSFAVSTVANGPAWLCPPVALRIVEGFKSSSEPASESDMGVGLAIAGSTLVALISVIVLCNFRRKI